MNPFGNIKYYIYPLIFFFIVIASLSFFTILAIFLIPIFFILYLFRKIIFRNIYKSKYFQNNYVYSTKSSTPTDDSAQTVIDADFKKEDEKDI